MKIKSKSTQKPVNTGGAGKSGTQQETVRLLDKLAELSCAVQPVVAHRMMRMALAGPVLSDRDQAEFDLMVREKHTAFSESASAMATEAAIACQQFALGSVWSFWCPWVTAAPAWTAGKDALFAIAGKGLAPVHRTAVANAHRLQQLSLG